MIQVLFHLCSSTLFIHSHIVDGQKIVHSHFFAGTATEHSHTTGSALTIQNATYGEAITDSYTPLGDIFALALYQHVSEVQFPSTPSIVHHSLRAPPSMA